MYQTADVGPDEMSYLYGFALAQGLESVGAISDAAYVNPDFLDVAHTVAVIARERHSVSVVAAPEWDARLAEDDRATR